MPTWVTHFMVADGVLERLPRLDRRGFCAGSIAPDCNVENEDWTAYTPSREVTHWMQGELKSASDCDAFCKEYILKRREAIRSPEEYAFLLGYYGHLITDAAFQAFLLHGERVRAAWRRIRAREDLRRRSEGMEESWPAIRRLVPRDEIMAEVYQAEAEYLRKRPDSGYLTDILPLREFPDYIDYLPSGCIVRKIGVMGYLPQESERGREFITISREEFSAFADRVTSLTVDKFREMGLEEVFCEKRP